MKNYLYIVNAQADLRMFHNAIVEAIRNGGKLPEELADLLSLTNLGPLNDDGSDRFLVDFI